MTAYDVLLGLRRPDGSTWGATATDWQRADAEAVLAVPNGPRRHWLGRPRGGSKTEDTAAMMLAVLLADQPRGALSYAAAASKDQAGLIRDSIRGFVINTPGLAGLVDVQLSRVVVPDRDVSLELLSADVSSSWGLRPFMMSVDEITGWGTAPSVRLFFEAIWTSLPKVPLSRAIVISTAGSPAHWSHKLWSDARSDPAWRVSDLHEPAPWIDPAEIESERRRLLPSLFARLWRNEWVQSEDRLVTAEDLDRCTRDTAEPLDPIPGAEYVCGLDIGLTNDRTVAVVAHREGDTVVVDRLATWQGRRGAAVPLAEVQAWLGEAARTYNGATVVFDPFSAVQLTQALAGAGIRTKQFNFTAGSVGRLGSGLWRVLREGRLSIPAGEDLRSELLNVRLRESTPGQVRLDHDLGQHDDQAVACALVVEALLGQGDHGFDAWAQYYERLAHPAVSSETPEPVSRTSTVMSGRVGSKPIVDDVAGDEGLTPEQWQKQERDRAWREGRYRAGEPW